MALINANERESRTTYCDNNENEQLDFEGFTEFLGEISGYSLHCQKQKEIYVCQPFLIENDFKVSKHCILN